MVRSRNGPPVLKPGTCIGRYRIESELGRGGASVVYLAKDLHLGKQWAVKVIRKDAPDGEDGSGRELSVEAELMKRLDHPALPRIVDILEEKGMLILIMDYIEGENLSSLLRRAGPFGEETVREWMYRLASVLAYLHGQDPPVIYRDMKPANVIRKPDGSLVLLDLGIAREYKTGRGLDTVALGTRGYAPPEQYGNAQTDIRSDIYSLGMTAAELLTGCPPDQDPYLYKTHPFRKLRPEISEEFDTILNRCLAFSPQDRYGSCRELMADLRKQPVKKAGGSVRGIRRYLPEKRLAGRKSSRGIKKRQPVRGRPVYVSGIKKDRQKNVPVRKGVLILAGMIAAESMAGLLTGAAEQPAVRAEAAAEPEQDRTKEIRELLNECDRKGVLTEEQSLLLQQQYAELPPEVRQDAETYAQICYAIGCAYLYAYSGENGSFRSRVLRAQPFFAEALTLLEAPDGPAGADPPEESVRNYVRLCDFFSLYMSDRNGIPEPDEEECREVLEAVRLCLAETAQQDTGDGAWLQLNLLQSMTELLREYRQNFADAEIEQEEILQILQTIREKATAVSVKRETLTELKEEVLADCAACREEVSRTYENIEKWKEAETVYEKKENS